jgi:hypothetical protein
LCAVSHELHQTTSHCFILSVKKKILEKNSILKIWDCLTFYYPPPFFFTLCLRCRRSS